MCQKKSYPDRWVAILELANLQSKSEFRPKTEKRTYWCRSCQAYHLTSMELKSIRRRRKVRP